MQLYWLGRSVPELADLPFEARWRLHRKTLLRAPWVIAIQFLLGGCCFLASFIPTVVITQEARTSDLTVFGISFLGAFVLSWIICRPVLFHFLRPKYRMLREGNEALRRSTH